VNQKTISFIIPINPRTKKNSSQIFKNRQSGKPFIVPSQLYRQYEIDCAPYIEPYNIDYPVNIKAIYYRATKHRVDLTNLNGALHDVLQKYNCIVDDSYKVVRGTDGSRIEFDNKKPRTVVTITEAKD